MEPTQPVPHYPEFNEPPAYLQPPPPPPPPRGPSRHQRDIILALVLLCCVLVIALPFTAYFVLYHPSQSEVSTPRPVVTPTASPTSPPTTPTLDTTSALQTNDFSRFYEAFQTLLTEGDYSALQTVVDTQNFQAISLRADPPFPDWHQFDSDLVTGHLSFDLPSSPLSPDNADYSCFGYDQTGVTYLNLQIPALQLMYAVGTAYDIDVPPDDVRNAPNGTVFIFELPDQNAPMWLWRAVTFNNALGC